MSESKLEAVEKVDKIKAQVYRAAPPPQNLPGGGAMFNGCGEVIGVNALVNDSAVLAIAADSLADGLAKAGAQVPVADKPCAAGASEASSNRSKGGKSHAPNWMPKGDQWIGVAFLAGLIGLALRPTTRRQVARALTTRRMPPPPVRATRPVLKGIAGQYAGASIALDSGPSLLGRDQTAANLVFGPDSDSVSKRHCLVRWDPARGAFTVEDLGSTNGTYLASGERLSPGRPRDLRPGERFYIGDLRNQFEVRMEE